MGLNNVCSIELNIMQEIKLMVEKMDSPEKVLELMDYLNFDNFTEPQKLNPESLSLRSKERDNVKAIYTINDYENTLRTFLIEVEETSNTIIKSLPEFFEMHLRYPFIILTDDYKTYNFVLVGKERKGRGEFETKIIKMELDRGEPKRTPIEILYNMKTNIDNNKKENPIELYNNLKNALDVDAVTRKFYKEYKNIFDELKKYFYNQKPEIENAKENSHRYSHQLLNRIMFIHFVQKKGWLGEKKEFINYYWDCYRREVGLNNTFHRKWLSVLFFEAFNNTFENKHYFPEKLNNILGKAPFLNGGLFAFNDLDKLGYKIEDDFFKEIFDFFNKYNFTIKEDTPLEIDVAVDPEMIGKVYESLVNISEESGERSDAGIFYTDRVEIDLMSKRSLVEYFNNHLELEKDLIYDLVFAINNKEKLKIDKKIDKMEYWGEIKELIENIKVVDPACGSGSFLIGMLEILFDLYYRSIKYLSDELSETNFEIKKEIIGRSLFGVDIMQWAVDVAELRLWLQLIIETDISEQDIKEKPLLPNLSFNIRQGDSLIQEIGGKDFSFGALENIRFFGSAKKDLQELSKEKYKFFRGDENSKFESEKDVKEAEINFYESLIQREIDEIVKNIEKYRDNNDFVQPKLGFGYEREQLKMEGMTGNSDESKIKKLEKRLEELKEIKNGLKKTKGNLFVWEIDFPGIFLGDKKGFDIVIGNPPYVRQEDIKPPLPNSPENYKDKLVSRINDKFNIRLSKRSDLYVYFYIHSLNLLNRKGTFCFITSNSWLDVKFGYNLQNFLLDRVKMKAIYDNSAKRSFEQADINTIITLFGPINKNIEENWENIVKFVVFKKPFGNIIDKNIMKEIENSRTKQVKDDYRVYPISQAELKDQGMEYRDSDKLEGIDIIDKINSMGEYKGDKWGGKYLRAPDVFFTILEKAKDKLIKLNEIADIRFGIKTGCNEFFYLPSKHFDIEYDGEFFRLIPIRDGLPDKLKIEKEYIKTVLKSPRECNSIYINKDELSKKVFFCPDNKNELSNKEALKYINWGEAQTFNKRSTVKSRKQWWSLEKQEYSKIFWPMTIRKKLGAYYCEEKILADARFYNVYTDNPKKAINLLNSTLTHLFLELIGRNYGGGGGPLDIKVYEIENLLVMPDVDLNKFSFSNRKLNSIFKECGINPNIPIKNQKPNPIKDRKLLDDKIFGSIGLNEEERNDVYRSLCKLVKNRLEKAKSV